MSLPLHLEQLRQIHEALASHGQRLESIANQLLGSDFPADALGSGRPGLPDGPSPTPAHIIGALESNEFDLRRQIERIGGAINRLESVLQDPRNAIASTSKY